MRIRSSCLWIPVVLAFCACAGAQEDTLRPKVPDSLISAETPSEGMPPLVSASAAAFDSRASMVHIEGRELDWLQTARRPRKSSDAPELRCGDFSIDRTEVTNRDFALFLSTSNSQAMFYDPRMDIVKTNQSQYLPKHGRENFPVAYVDWMGAYAFAEWAGKSLPTEAEWIVAALDGRMIAGADSTHPWGDESPDSTRGNFLAFSGFPGKMPVASFPSGATPNNISDLAGNVAEWTLTEVTSKVPSGDSHSWMVVKGGSFLDPYENVSITDRVLRDRSERLGSLGFRCIVRDQPSK